MASISLFLLALLVVSCVVSSQGVRTGGLRDIDVNHHTVKDLVKDLPSMTNKLDDLEIVKVVRAQRQVVSGMNYVLTIDTRRKGTDGPATQECKATIWIQSWLEKRTLTSMKCKDVPASGIPGGSSEGDRLGVRPGGLSDIDVQNIEVQDIVKKLPSMTKELKGLEIVKVVRAQRQVVSGFRYVLTIQTRSKKSNGPATQKCKVSVWIQSWLNRRKVTSIKCKPVNAMGIPGGWSKGEITDTVRQAAKIGLELMDRKCNCMKGKSISEVKSVQQKVVAGMLYRIRVGIIKTSCRNSKENQRKGLKKCPEQECEITMLSQPWLKPEFKLLKHTCKGIPLFKKRP